MPGLACQLRSDFLQDLRRLSAPLFDLALDLADDLGVLRLLLEGAAVAVLVEADPGALADEVQEAEDLGGLLLRQHVDLQVEVIAALGELRLAFWLIIRIGAA